jgi:hypothetical protein
MDRKNKRHFRAATPAAPSCAPQLLYLRHAQVGPQTTRTEPYAKQRWTIDFPAGIIARGHNPR